MISKKKVAQICKKHRALKVCTLKGGTQWVGTANAFYVMDGLPKMTPEEYTSAFDFSEKDISESSIAEVDVSRTIEADEEIIVQAEPTEFIYGNEKYLCFSEEFCFAVIPAALLTPIIMDSTTSFYIKPGAPTVVCVKHGLCPEAIIVAMAFPEPSANEIEKQCYAVIDAVRKSIPKTYPAEADEQERLE